MNKNNGNKMRTRRNIPENERIAIFEAWGHKCVYCRDQAMHIDHIYPFAKGGVCELENLVPACEKHNLFKSDSVLTEAGMELLLTKAKEKAPIIRKRIESYSSSTKPIATTPGLMDRNLTYTKSEFPVYVNKNISLRGIKVFLILLQNGGGNILFSELNRSIHLTVDDLTHVIMELYNFSPKWAEMESVFDDICISSDGQWMIKYSINPCFVDHFNKIYNSTFGSIRLDKFRSKYSILLYMYFMNYKCNKGSVTLSISNLRNLLLIDEELYDKWGNIRQKILYPVFDELKSYGMYSSITDIVKRGKKTEKIKIAFDKTEIQ
jgi:hypothetical protein